MALTKLLDENPVNLIKELQHKAVLITDGALTTLISGLAGKRIRIYSIIVSCAASLKTCEMLSGANTFISICRQDCQLQSNGSGIPVFTCNAGEDFKADPSDTTNWYFYIVYTVCH